MIVNTLYGLEEIADTKMCYSCKEIKHLDDFAHRGHRKDGTRETKNICKPCNKKQVKILNDQKKYFLKPDVDYKCPICNLTEQEIKDRGAFQGFTSATSKTVWVLDHDHKTGKGRAYICDYCNIMIGRSLDKPEVLESGAAYLRKHNV